MSASPGTGVAAEVLKGLKDFQLRTVEHVFERLYLTPGASRRFLVADEVGLGKTLVARGVVARAVDHLREQKVPRIDVLYICSNGDIARQNIQRLKLDGEHVALASRLTMLPLEVGRLRQTTTGVNFISFTPSTSFDLSGGMGQVQERVLLYWMLRRAWNFGATRSAMNVFQGHVGPDRFRSLVDGFDPDRIDEGAQKAFEKALAQDAERAARVKERPLSDRFEDLKSTFSRSDKNTGTDDNRSRNAFVGELRALLAKSCVDPLEPDLVILDEFQRFSHLLDDTESDASALARAVFEHPDVRVLLLSATPYKMYTLHDDSAGEDHYGDFLRTVRFLEGGTTDGQIEADLERYRTSVIGVAQSDGVDRLRRAKASLEARLSRVMVRTERLASTPDRSGMLREVAAAPLELSSADVRDYLAVQAVARAVDQPDCIEYWKSAPYALSFLDEGYKLKSEIRAALEVGEGRMKVARALSISPGSALPWDKIEGYDEVGGGNPRMRALLRDYVDVGAYRLLWIPPSMPYYALGGAFAAEPLQRMTKRLVFSSWRVVPRAIAALVSYDVERRIWTDPKASYTPEFRERQRPLLRFGRATEGRLTGMPVLALLYPSLYLAEACDPARLSRDLASEKAPIDGSVGVRSIPASDVLQLARGQIALAVERHLPQARSDGPEDERWYWAAPLLLDRKLRESTTMAWFAQKDLADRWAGVEAGVETGSPEEAPGAPQRGRELWTDHVEEARRVAVEGAAAACAPDGATALGRMPVDLVDVLAQLAVGGPAVTMLRALLHVVGGESALDESSRVDLRNGAGKTAWAFRALFNQPEVMALLRGPRAEGSSAAAEDAGSPYWQLVLSYCVDGCLQAVLDEYVHVLRDHLGLVTGTVGERVHEIADEIVPAIELRTSRVGVDSLDLSEAGRTVRREAHNLRTHFALRYGDEKSDDGKVVTRADQVRKAFNSPFWPFVLATTSVGQEGLDFHTYCHAVVHWNIPSNPVDFEQREGRVHRYKGHAVRKNVAQAFGEQAVRDEDRDRWESIFARACEARPSGSSDIVPFWIQLGGDARIERHVPALPLSHDRARADRLRASLAVYRMVFGQPRQEDLVAYLLDRVSPDSLASLMDELRIDLSVPERENAEETRQRGSGDA